ncbi:MAG: leucyl aminopeptidase family protein [Alphaproteobacteria bacterium]
MSSQKFALNTPFIAKPHKNHIMIHAINTKNFDTWCAAQNSKIQNTAAAQGFNGKSGQILITYDIDGNINTITAGTEDAPTYLDGSKIHDELKTALSKNLLENTSFEIAAFNNPNALERLQIGWGWAAYAFTPYKKQDDNDKTISLVLNEKSDERRITTFVESVCLIRDLVNLPPNDMGPDELQTATEFIASQHGVKTKTIKDGDLIKKNFPMIYDVGKGSARRPRLLDFSWGNKKHPKVTLVGKGVCFDTGGYDVKSSKFMINMKKDMGGAAHVLALAHMIMRLELPISLRVLIPAVENSISGEAYRPSDILQSRKGLTVEVGNTDAEGRLVLADALTYACEEAPELIIDFATLTGAARVALGPDLPALFSNNEEIAQAIQKLSQDESVDDAVWNLPLWKPYRKDIDSLCADLSSTGGKAGATTAALFLNEFVEETIDWIHMDSYAWEDNGTTGRPKGGADCGLRAIYAYLEDRYAK